MTPFLQDVSSIESNTTIPYLELDNQRAIQIENFSEQLYEVLKKDPNAIDNQLRILGEFCSKIDPKNLKNQKLMQQVNQIGHYLKWFIQALILGIVYMS